MVTQTKDHLKSPTFPLSHFSERSGDPDPQLRARRGSLSHFLTSKGFSLLEVIIAVVILSFGLLAIMQLFPIGLKAGKISQDTTVATFLAQQKIEGLKNVVYDSLTGGTEDYGSITGYGEFKRVTTIQNDVSSISPELTRITVEVFYKPYGGERSVKLVTLRTNYQERMP